MIFTSYFAKLKNLPDNAIPVSICGKAPDWYKGCQYKKLAPKYSFFSKWKETHDDDYYIQHFYEEILNTLNANEVIKEIYSLIQDKDKDIILICYEKPGDFCHRHLVAEWLTEYGYPTEEYKFDK